MSNKPLNQKPESRFFKELDKFISRSRRGKRLMKNRTPVSQDAIDNYLTLKNQLRDFTSEEDFPLHLPKSRKLNSRRFRAERKYWKKFYLKFTDYLFCKKKYVDNYVGNIIKLLNTFFNYLHDEYCLNGKAFRQTFHAPREEIQFIVLSVERLNFLTSDKEFESTLSEKHKRIKDIFVFGCRVALRVSDLMSLTSKNLETVGNSVYLNVLSKKTKTFTRVLLPEPLVKIIEKYKGGKLLLPFYHPVYINQYGKELMEKAGWTETVVKWRQRNGEPFQVYKDPVKKLHYRFCDHVASHLMRRTAITTMIALGMNEQAVRRISGHSPNSREFYRYVTYAQTYIDEAMVNFYKKLEEIGRRAI